MHGTEPTSRNMHISVKFETRNTLALPISACQACGSIIIVSFVPCGLLAAIYTTHTTHDHVCRVQVVIDSATSSTPLYGTAFMYIYILILFCLILNPAYSIHNPPASPPIFSLALSLSLSPSRSPSSLLSLSRRCSAQPYPPPSYYKLHRLFFAGAACG